MFMEIFGELRILQFQIIFPYTHSLIPAGNFLLKINNSETLEQGVKCVCVNFEHFHTFF